MSKHLRARRSRRSLLTKQQSQEEDGGGDDDGTSLRNESEFELAGESTRDDSDSVPKLVIKEEPDDDNRIEEKIDLERKYECNTCKPSHEFLNITDYLQHLKHEDQQQRRKINGCPYCNYSYQNSKKLQRHILTAHKDVQGDKSRDIVRRNRCTMCNFIAYTPTDMENHQRHDHLKRRFFRCTKCCYMTHVRARYTKHVKYHSMPMIKCDDCDFRTPYKWNLDRHTRNHGGGGAFQCHTCNFTADIRQSLTVHETNHHDPPIGQMAGKMSSSFFGRKPRNSLKRHNQVGASDYRNAQSIEKSSTSPPAIVENSLDSEDEKNTIDGADCIALKCEEKGCQFITSWNSEMQRHLAESHATGCHTPSKRKPLPMLIPLSPGSKPTNDTSSSPTTVLNVPRVRVRPELAKIARDTEIAKLYNNSEINTGVDIEDSPPMSNNFHKRNASFFDKLKERLLTSSASSSGINNQVAGVSNVDDLKCWCTFEANSPDEMSSHKKTHHTALSVSLGVSRCPKCRRRCKTSSDLQMHIKICSAYNNNNNDNDRNISQENTVISDSYATTSSSNDFELPLQVDWDANHSGLNSSGSSLDGVSTNSTARRVFKCPHCPFWASTASRFHVHIVGHLNRKPFECSLCAYRSNWRWDITKHIKLKAARDPGHLNARVLMTDETGRRNYSKYNKYLTQLEHQSPANLGIEDTQGGLRSGEPPRKLFVMGNSTGVLKRRQKSMNSLTIDVSPGEILRQSGSQQSKIHGQSLLKMNPSTSVSHGKEPLSFSPKSSQSEDTKRTLWKCKRCNYRDSSKEVLLQHVKSHYEKLDKGANVKGNSNELTCTVCPYIAHDTESLAMHKVHHRQNLEAIFKCYLCPYYVSTKAELLDHARLHGEELAVVHHQSNGDKNEGDEQTKITPTSSIIIAAGGVIGDNDGDDNDGGGGENCDRAPLLLDTRALPDTPLVWVSRPDGTFAKMLKCRHCPHVSSRRAEVRDHETMHINDSNGVSGVSIACPDCSFTCNQRDIMESHANMHLGSLGTVHCLVADNRSDAQQLDDLKSILGLVKIPTLGPEPDLRDSRLVHNCAKCPARFLCEKELRIHLRYHSTSLAYTCEWCSYAARQPAHLLAHQKAHSSEYQERTRYLSSLYGNSQRYPPPMTACVEVKTQMNNDRRHFAWIVVEIANQPSQQNNEQQYSNTRSSLEQKNNQVFTCTKCPARYFKLDALEYHMTLHGSNNRFKCEECDYSSKTAQNLMKHQVVHRRQPDTIEQSQEPIEPRLQFPSTTADSQLLNTVINGNPNFVYPGYVRNGKLKEKKYKCHKCPSAFEKREQYRIHLSLHGCKQKYKCDKCDYAVKYYANYIQHLKKHQANAEAQASRRQMEVDNDNVINRGKEQCDFTKSRRKSTTGNGNLISINSGDAISPVSNQDMQTMMLMQRKTSLTLSESNENPLRCLECPFSAADQAVLDAHKRRHGIERQTPPCPHCNYVPRKDENLNEHIRLHFTRMYKPEGYLIVEMLSLRMEKHVATNQHDKNKENNILLFSECSNGKFLPITDVISTLPAITKKERGFHERVVIVDANTGDATHRVKD